jgi:hypothetical protein
MPDAGAPGCSAQAVSPQQKISAASAIRMLGMGFLS